MSKQHHFVVWFDTETKAWEIGYARFDEDEPVFDTETENWERIDSKSSDVDSEIFEDLRQRLMQE